MKCVICKNGETKEGTTMIIERLKNEIFTGMEIPKPEAKKKFTVKGWGKRRGEEALVYYIPNNSNPNNPYQKGITLSEWRQAYNQLEKDRTFTRKWFQENMTPCNGEGGCNFTTIGGIFSILKIAEYSERGIYRKIDRSGEFCHKSLS